MLKSSYLHKVLKPNKLAETILSVHMNLFPVRNTFSTIAFMGMSGALVAPTVATLLNKDLILVRKTLKDVHSNYKVEGRYNPCHYIIIDDFAESGDTINNIVKAVSKINKTNKCIGVYLYNDWLTSSHAKFPNIKILNPTDYSD